MKSQLIIFLFFIFSFSSLACPPCPSGSSTAGTGAATNLAGCKCTSGTDTWNGSACVPPTPPGCPAVTPATWNTNCSANLGAAASGAAASVLTNTAGGYTGSATYSCSSGTWTISSNSCSVAGCTTGYGTPDGGANCTVPNGNWGSTTVQSGCTLGGFSRSSFNVCNCACDSCAGYGTTNSCNNGSWAISFSSFYYACNDFCSGSCVQCF